MGASAKAVDFSGVKDRGAFNPRRVPDGDYAAVITKVEDTPTKESGEFMYTFTIKLKKFSQHSYPYRCKLADNQLWKLRNIAMAAGINVPKKRMKFDPNKVVGKQIGVTMVEDEYEGKPKSEVDAVFPVSELMDGELIADDAETDDNFDEEAKPQLAGGDDDEADDEPAPKAKKKDKAAKEGKAGKEKKGKKKKGDDDNLESLDISDV